ncbi:hypothetical protein GQ602_007410 [Ophiocordyceps camponoti-floridani]|uniref:Uncharacterized protein n=1 Tax=Ophiocordyceps camponoti-floridani TaxID=2030778 RepID=A0A8H4Q0G0_9HYPO|nr:hypothetical protein GQ602_007410 [Ophiocordyceps camponoti-floridani]
MIFGFVLTFIIGLAAAKPVQTSTEQDQKLFRRARHYGSIGRVGSRLGSGLKHGGRISSVLGRTSTLSRLGSRTRVKDGAVARSYRVGWGGKSPTGSTQSLVGKTAVRRTFPKRVVSAAVANSGGFGTRAVSAATLTTAKGIATFFIVLAGAPAVIGVLYRDMSKYMGQVKSVELSEGGLRLDFDSRARRIPGTASATTGPVFSVKSPESPQGDNLPDARHVEQTGNRFKRPDEEIFSDEMSDDEELGPCESEMDCELTEFDNGEEVEDSWELEDGDLEDCELDSKPDDESTRIAQKGDDSSRPDASKPGSRTWPAATLSKQNVKKLDMMRLHSSEDVGITHGRSRSRADSKFIDEANTAVPIPVHNETRIRDYAVNHGIVRAEGAASMSEDDVAQVMLQNLTEKYGVEMLNCFLLEAYDNGDFDGSLTATSDQVAAAGSEVLDRPLLQIPNLDCPQCRRVNSKMAEMNICQPDDDDDDVGLSDLMPSKGFDPCSLPFSGCGPDTVTADGFPIIPIMGKANHRKGDRGRMPGRPIRPVTVAFPE